MATTTRRKLLTSGAALLAGSGLALGASAAERVKPSRFYTARSLKGASKGIGKVASPTESVHLINRLTYGVTGDLLAQVDALGYEGFVEQQLNYEDLDDSELEGLLSLSLPTINQDFAQLIQLDDEGQNQAAIELLIATLLRRLYSPRQLFERMVEFWNDHFSVYLFDGPLRYMKTVEDRELMRPNALGKFRDLAQGNARSPAMLYYLDNFSNIAQSPNENYSRELLELHTLGVDGGYTEDDVKEAARCFTGWSIDTRRADLFGFFAVNHDFDEKTVLGQTFPAGQGIEDGQQLLDLLAEHPATARYISSKLAMRFVSDQPSDALVDSITQTYLDTDGDIREMMRTLLLSDEFRSAFDEKFKRPSELLISQIRVLDPFTANDFLRLFFGQLDVLGHLPFTWGTPDGFPDFIDHWVNSTGLLNRWNIGIGVGDGSYAQAVQVKIFDLLGDARTPNDIVDRGIDQILHRPVTNSDRNALVTYVAGGLPANEPLKLSRAVTKMRNLIGLLMGSRYFQFR